MRNKLILFFLVWFIGITIIFFMIRQSAPISAMIYWIVLGLFILSIYLFKLNTRLIFLFSFGLFILAGLLTALNLNFVAEIVMRLSLLGWLIGLGQVPFEYFFKKK